MAGWDTAVSVALVGWQGMGLAALCGLCLGPISARIPRGTARRAAVGLLFGAASVAAMLSPVPLADGNFLDTRWILMAFGAAFGGPAGLVVAAAAAVPFRLWLGGPGAVAAVIGMGVSGGLALFWRSRFKERAPGAAGFAALGLLASAHALTFPLIRVENPAGVAALSWLSLAPAYVAAAVVLGLVARGRGGGVAAPTDLD